jgi:hypothetical protein
MAVSNCKEMGSPILSYVRESEEAVLIHFVGI